MKQFIVALVIVASSFLATACVSTGGTYSRGQVGTVQQVNFGTVEHVRAVFIDGKSGVGAGIVAVVGGIVGSGIGSGRGRDLATVLGAVGGGVHGSKAQKELTKVDGVELTVRLDNGRVVAVIQELSREAYLSVGDRVRVITLHGKARVLPATT